MSPIDGLVSFVHTESEKALDDLIVTSGPTHTDEDKVQALLKFYNSVKMISTRLVRKLAAGGKINKLT